MCGRLNLITMLDETNELASDLEDFFGEPEELPPDLEILPKEPEELPPDIEDTPEFKFLFKKKVQRVYL